MEPANTLTADFYRRDDSQVSWRRRLKEYQLFLRLFVAPIERSVHLLYEMDSTHNIFAEQSLYRNLGYWEKSPSTLDEACQAMAELVGEAAQFKHDDHILDVGFGFADQDLFWMEHFSPQRIVGLNIIPEQVQIGRARVAQHRLQDRIELNVGSATEMPFEAESFDKVVALECAFHFLSRETFFHEAYRVLRPGGRLTTVEPLPMPGEKPSWLASYMQRSLVATPKENIYPRDVYAEKLAGAGFENVRVTSIREHVYPHFMRYLARRIESPEIKRRFNPLILGFWKGWIATFDTENPEHNKEHDYILAVADKLDR